MVPCAPRLSPRLVAAIERHDDGTRAVAEVWRDVCTTAEGLGLVRPSYERVRSLVKEHRARRARFATTREVLTDTLITRGRPLDALHAHVAGIGVVKRR